MIRLDKKALELRILCRQYANWMALFSEVQLQFRSVLDLEFSGYDKAFQNIFNPTSLQLLTFFPTPKAFLAAAKEEVLKTLLHNRRGRKWNEEKYEALVSIARSSLPDPNGTGAHQLALRNYMELIKAYQAGISSLEERMKVIGDQAPFYHLLRSISGVGPITAAMIYAEIEDIKRFPSVKQLTAFAGLDSSVFESGTFKASQNRISKQGSALSPHNSLPSYRCGNFKADPRSKEPGSMAILPAKMLGRQTYKSCHYCNYQQAAAFNFRHLEQPSPFS